MKRMKNFTYAMAALAMLSISSCTDEQVSTEEKVNVGIEIPTQESIFATSISVKLRTLGAESFVCEAIKGEDAAEPDPIIAYAKAQEEGRINQVSSETTDFIVEGLEGNTTYTLFFIFKVGSEYKIEKQVVTTSEYSQMVTMISCDMTSFTFHVDVPDSVYYSLSIQTKEQYESYAEGFGYTDLDWVSYSGRGMQNQRYKGPQTITISNGKFMYEGALNEEDYKELEAEGYTYAIHPGTAYVLFVSQCDENGMTDNYVEKNEDYGGGGWGPMTMSKLPNIIEYTETAPDVEYGKFTGKFAKTIAFTQQATKPEEGGVTVNTTKLTEKTVYFDFIPSDNILNYAIILIDNENKEELYNYVGGAEGVQAACLTAANYILEGAQSVSYPIEKGHTYTLYVTGVCNESGTVQTFDVIENIQPIVSNKPAPELSITALESNDPYQVGYNIKAINKDCAAFKYLCNYTKEWYPQLNGLETESLEASIYTMISAYGQLVSDETIISAINSENGYDIYFSSMDETESWLVVEAFNSDEVTKLYYDEEGCRATSGKLVPEEPVNSTLFEDLKGSWIGTMYNANTGDSIKFPVTIAAGHENVTVLPSDVKEELVGYFMGNGYSESEAEASVNAYFKEYQDKTQYFTQKYKDQNCLIATGFEYDDYSAVYASPWDLFCSTEYSAYSTEELFRDFGPKLFFKIAKDELGNDSVSVITTRYQEDGYNYFRYVDPVASWSQDIVLSAYNSTTPSNYYTTEFPVSISEDKNTVIIESVEQDGQYYAPSFAIEYMVGYPYWSFCSTTTGIKLERASEADVKSRASITRKVTPKVKPYSKNRLRRTRTLQNVRINKLINGEVFTLDKFKAETSK